MGRKVETPVLDFTDCPDLAQPVMVALAAGGLTWRLQGLHSLPWKETNRLKAMQRELGKVGIRLYAQSPMGVWEFSGVLRMGGGLGF
jgi:3-phosphoshikimate 1-carboxyvinyltransferase